MKNERAPLAKIFPHLRKWYFWVVAGGACRGGIRSVVRGAGSKDRHRGAWFSNRYRHHQADEAGQDYEWAELKQKGKKPIAWQTSGCVKDRKTQAMRGVSGNLYPLLRRMRTRKQITLFVWSQPRVRLGGWGGRTTCKCPTSEFSVRLVLFLIRG